MTSDASVVVCKNPGRWDAFDMHLQIIVCVAITLLAGLLYLALRNTSRSSRSVRSRLQVHQQCPTIVNHLPWGLDRIEQIYRATNEARLMELFLFHFNDRGTTLEHTFLGVRSFGTIDPRNLEAMLNSKFDDWSLGAREQALRPLLGTGIFMLSGESWKHARAVFRPQFAIHEYEDTTLFAEPLDRLLSSLPRAGVIDLQPHLLDFTLDVALRHLCGTSMSKIPTHSWLEFARSFNLAQDFVGQRMRLPGVYWLISGRRCRQACTTAYGMVDQIIAKSSVAYRPGENVSRSSGGPLLHRLINAYQDRDVLRSHVMNILVASRDTTACLISWTLYVTLVDECVCT